ncbi:MAG: HEAT repeat domain-containing protein [Deltaproteobacteria bacterium]|nr:HEAT repeat domain-containing protein [Deltaproteobacteria bacterium]
MSKSDLPAELLARVRAADAALLDEPRAPRGSRGLEELVVALGAADATAREQAADALGILADARAVPSLRAHAHDPVPAVRSAVLAALARLARDPFFPELVKALRSEDARVVAGAAVVLGRLGDRAVVPNLIEAFQTEDLHAGTSIAWALGRLGDRAVLPWLIAAVEQGFAAPAAAEALGRLGDPRAVPALLTALEADDDPTRAAAARALGRCQAASAAPALALRLNDPSAKVRLAAAISLWELGEGPQAIAAALG